MSSTNKTDRHDITELLLKVALNTINLKPYPIIDVLPVVSSPIEPSPLPDLPPI